MVTMTSNLRKGLLRGILAMRLLNKASRWLAALVVALCLLGTGQQAFAQDCLNYLTPGDIKFLGPEYFRMLQIAQDSSIADEGIALVLRVRASNGDGLKILKEILERLDDAPLHFERLGRVGDKPNVGLVMQQLANAELKIHKGGAAVLRYATHVLGPNNVGEFEKPLPGTVADIVDSLGNFVEVKHRNYADRSAYPAEFMVINDLDDILTQAQKCAAAAKDKGVGYTLAFELAIPPGYVDRFDLIFKELASMPHVTIRRTGF
jgi:hypothetical protein